MPCEIYLPEDVWSTGKKSSFQTLVDLLSPHKLNRKMKPFRPRWRDLYSAWILFFWVCHVTRFITWICRRFRKNFRKFQTMVIHHGTIHTSKQKNKTHLRKKMLASSHQITFWLLEKTNNKKQQQQQHNRKAPFFPIFSKISQKHPLGSFHTWKALEMMPSGSTWTSLEISQGHGENLQNNYHQTLIFPFWYWFVTANFTHQWYYQHF